MPINFPDSPSVNDTHTVGDRTWVWDGTTWTVIVGGVPTSISEFSVTGDLNVGQDAEIDGILTANHIHGNIAGSVYLHVKNTSGVTIPAGSPVYATGSVGASGATEIAASDASTAATMPALGITQSELVANAEGHATILGVIGSLDTSTYGLNDSLYVAPGGGLTDTRPTALTDLVQKIGRVVRVDGSTGEILVLGAGRTNDVPNNVVAGGLTIDTDTLHVDSTNDRVGIGTTSPTQKLQVAGSIVATDLFVTDASSFNVDVTDATYVRIGNTSASADEFEMVSLGSMDFVIDSNNNSTGKTFQWVTNGGKGAGTTLMTLTDTGDLGIGTTAPAANLQVVSQNRAVSIIDSGTTNVAEVGFTSLGADSPAFGRLSGYDVDIFTGTTRAGLSSGLHVHRDGNVGIGDTTPSYKLDVAGSFRATGVSYFENTLYVDSNDNTTPFYVGRYTSSVEAIGISVADRDGFIFMNQDETSGASYIHIENRGAAGSTKRTYFNCNIHVPSVVKSGTSNFQINHPLPEMNESHWLIHTGIEGPNADNLYRGTVTLVDGTASVNLDTEARMTEGTFVALNRCVQCFTTNETDWGAVKGSVDGNVLTITAQDTTSTATVSWMVIGERKDQSIYDSDRSDSDGRALVEIEQDDPSIAPRTWQQYQDELANQGAN